MLIQPHGVLLAEWPKAHGPHGVPKGQRASTVKGPKWIKGSLRLGSSLGQTVSMAKDLKGLYGPGPTMAKGPKCPQVGQEFCISRPFGSILVPFRFLGLNIGSMLVPFWFHSIYFCFHVGSNRFHVGSILDPPRRITSKFGKRSNVQMLGLRSEGIGVGWKTVGSPSETSIRQGPGKRINGVPGGPRPTLGKIQGKNSSVSPKHHFLSETTTPGGRARHCSRTPQAPWGPSGPTGPTVALMGPQVGPRAPIPL